MSSVNVCVIAQAELVCMYRLSQGLGTQQHVCACCLDIPVRSIRINSGVNNVVMKDYEHEKTLISLHIGNEIKRVMKEQGRSVTWLSHQLYCDRTNIYKIFSKSSIDTTLLLRISIALNHNFFNYLNRYYSVSVSVE